MATVENLNIQVNSPEWFGKEKGLRLNLENTEKLSKVECPNYECEMPVEFYPDNLYWNKDDNGFEFCEVSCLACKEKFELCANPGTENYEFFTT